MTIMGKVLFMRHKYSRNCKTLYAPEWLYHDFNGIKTRQRVFLNKLFGLSFQYG
jgi:hypothetical protein